MKKITIQQLLIANIHKGQKANQRNHQNNINILATHKDQDIINLEKTLQTLNPLIKASKVS